MRTRPKPSKWRAYNLRRKRLPWYASRDRRNRADTAARKRAAADARLIADHEALLASGLPPPFLKTKPLALRFTIEVVGHGRHRFTATWCPVFKRWSVPQRRIIKGISALMKHAPVIATAS